MFLWLHMQSKFLYETLTWFEGYAKTTLTELIGIKWSDLRKSNISLGLLWAIFTEIIVLEFILRFHEINF